MDICAPVAGCTGRFRFSGVVSAEAGCRGEEWQDAERFGVGERAQRRTGRKHNSHPRGGGLDAAAVFRVFPRGRAWMRQPRLGDPDETSRGRALQEARGCHLLALYNSLRPQARRGGGAERCERIRPQHAADTGRGWHKKDAAGPQEGGDWSRIYAKRGRRREGGTTAKGWEATCEPRNTTWDCASDPRSCTWDEASDTRSYKWDGASSTPCACDTLIEG